MARQSTRAYWREVQAVFQDPYAAFNQFYSVKKILANALQLSEKKYTSSERNAKMDTVLKNVGLKAQEIFGNIRISPRGVNTSAS
ncbi:MAG: hypothetical protein ACRCYY_02925 [Trueperaceae bacterium]